MEYLVKFRRTVSEQDYYACVIEGEAFDDACELAEKLASEFDRDAPDGLVTRAAGVDGWEWDAKERDVLPEGTEALVALWREGSLTDEQVRTDLRLLGLGAATIAELIPDPDDLARTDKMVWRDIATAPNIGHLEAEFDKVDHRVLLDHPEWRQAAIGFRWDKDGPWAHTDEFSPHLYGTFDPQPTVWMPIPSIRAPKEA